MNPFKRKISGLFFIIFIFFSSGCESVKLGEFQTTLSKNLGNGKTLILFRMDSYEKNVGMITGHNYGVTHTYKYSFKIKPENIEWKGYIEAEPKKIIFCLNELVLVTFEDVYAEDNEQKAIKKRMNRYFKHVDNRYFFNFFGEQYWLEITRKEMKLLSTGSSVEEIPSIKPAPIQGE